MTHHFLEAHGVTNGSRSVRWHYPDQDELEAALSP